MEFNEGYSTEAEYQLQEEEQQSKELCKKQSCQEVKDNQKPEEF